ncbi:MAG: ROK family transcriptional regulator [Planctomycetota bacterium]|jgi:predicted NBD/HSP70 family sugar kinase
MHKRTVPIDSKSAGQKNENLILSMLHERKKLSQTQLCRMAGIGSSTASTIVARLREKGLVLERRGQSSNRGPKPTYIELNPAARYVIGIEISPSYLFIGLFNFILRMTDKIRIPLEPDHSVEQVIDLLSVNVNGLLSRNEVVVTKVLGAGVTLSGSILPDGCVSLSSPMRWKDVHLKDRLQPCFAFPVSVYSNRVRLLSELLLNPDLTSKNILYFNVATGVGSTVYMDGKLIFGATGRYGEIGHIVIDPDGPVCGCGNRGCLEAFISGRALVDKITHDWRQGVEVSFAEVTDDDSLVPEEVLKGWSEAAVKGNTYAIALRDYVAEHYAKAVCMLINCYDPDVLILAGYVSQHFTGFFADCIRNRMSTDVYDTALRDIRIIPAGAGADALVKGAAIAATRKYLVT